MKYSFTLGKNVITQNDMLWIFRVVENENPVERPHSGDKMVNDLK